MQSWLAWIYGLLAIASGFVAGSMAAEMRAYVRMQDRPAWRTDKYLGLTLALMLHGLAGVLLWGPRAWDVRVNAQFNLGTFIWLTLFSLALYAFSKGWLVMISASNHRHLIRYFLICCTAWSLISWLVPVR